MHTKCLTRMSLDNTMMFLQSVTAGMHERAWMCEEFNGVNQSARSQKSLNVQDNPSALRQRKKCKECNSAQFGKHLSGACSHR